MAPPTGAGKEIKGRWGEAPAVALAAWGRAQKRCRPPTHVRATSGAGGFDQLQLGALNYAFAALGNWH
jgi:hypothetical protein